MYLGVSLVDCDTYVFQTTGAYRDVVLQILRFSNRKIENKFSDGYTLFS